jgi:hypothetical protein
MLTLQRTISCGYSPKRVTKPRRQDRQKTSLFNVWSKGLSARDYLAFEARLQDFQVEIISSSKTTDPVRRDETSRALFSLVRENIYQHGGSEGIYLSRSIPAGYEFIGFDYGGGVTNKAANPVDDLTAIFNANTGYGSRGDSGNATFSLARMTYLTRIISANAGTIKVVDKKPGKIARSPVPVSQTNFSMDGEKTPPTGFIIHGFIMRDFPLPTFCSFLPPHPTALLSPIVGQE